MKDYAACPTARNGMLYGLVPLLLIAAPADAQQTPAGQPMAGTAHYDVVLEVPELSVGEIELTVSGLRAQLALDALAANLVSVSAGAVVGIDRVELGLYGILAEAYLYVDLDNVSHIVRRVVQTIDNNPQLLTRLLESADSLVRATGGIANTALQPGGIVSQTVGAVGQTLDQVTRPGGLLSQTVNSLGQTVRQSVTQTGSLVEHTLDSTGNIVNERTLGSALSLPLIRESRNAAGQTLRLVRSAAGSVIELTLDAAGNVTGARVLQ